MDVFYVHVHIASPTAVLSLILVKVSSTFVFVPLYPQRFNVCVVVLYITTRGQ